MGLHPRTDTGEQVEVMELPRAALTGAELEGDIWYAYEWPHCRSVADIEHFLLYARAASTTDVGCRSAYGPPGWGALGWAVRRTYYAVGPESSRVEYEVCVGAASLEAEQKVGEIMAKRATREGRRQR